MDIKDEIRGRLEEYLISKGLTVQKGMFFHCLNPNHADEHPSMSYNAGKNQVHCFSCDATYDIYDVIGIDYGLNTFAEQYNKAREIFGYPILSSKTNEQKGNFFLNGKHFSELGDDSTDFTDMYRSAYKNRKKAMEYLEGRGLSASFADKYCIGYYYGYKMFGDPSKVCNAVIFPVSKGCYVARNVEVSKRKPYRYSVTGRPLGIWNADVIAEACRSGRPLFVTEAVLDALSIVEAGGYAVSLNGTSNITLLLSYLQELDEETAHNAVIIPACDNDDAGRKANRNLTIALEMCGCQVCSCGDLYGKEKDANDSLRADREAFVRKIRNLQTPEGITLQQFENTESSGAKMENFMERIYAGANQPRISTGFPTLDAYLRGGLHPEMYIIGAIPSIGKTTLVTQMKDAFAEQGQYVLFFSLETPEEQILTKTVSRLIYKAVHEKNPQYAKDVEGILDGRLYSGYEEEEKQIIVDKVQECGRINRKCRIYEGMDISIDYICNETKNFIHDTGILPVLIIDYLQIVSVDAKYLLKDDKVKVDIVLNALRQLSMEEHIPIIVISSLNRVNYNNPLTIESFKSSGDIEYRVDNLLGLQYQGVGTAGFDLKVVGNACPRKLELCILKQRNGVSNVSFPLAYIPQYNYFFDEHVPHDSKMQKQDDFANVYVA